MTESERINLKTILRKINDTEDACRKVKTMQMQLIINRDALLYLKATISGWLYEAEKEK